AGLRAQARRRPLAAADRLGHGGTPSLPDLGELARAEVPPRLPRLGPVWKPRATRLFIPCPPDAAAASQRIAPLGLAPHGAGGRRGTPRRGPRRRRPARPSGWPPSRAPAERARLGRSDPAAGPGVGHDGTGPGAIVWGALGPALGRRRAGPGRRPRSPGLS